MVVNLFSDMFLLVFGDLIVVCWLDSDFKFVFGVVLVKLVVGGDWLEYINWIVSQVWLGVYLCVIVIVFGINNVNYDSDCEFDSCVEVLMSSVCEKFLGVKIYEMNIMLKGVG